MVAERARESKAIRLYQALLRLYPAEFRDEYGRELCLVLRDRYRQQRSALGVLLVWLHAAWGIAKEVPREHWHMILQDLKYAIRILRKDALVTAAAIAILALGIGSTTLVFSVGNGLLVRPLPYAEPGRLVAVQEYRRADPSPGGNVAFPNYHDLRARTRLLADLGVYTEGTSVLRGDGEAEQVPAAEMSDGVFPVLGVAPVTGRWFSREETGRNGPRVVVLSHRLWHGRYGGDPNILGRTLRLGTNAYRVIGIMPAGFHFPQRAELWTPLQLDPATAPRTDYFLEAVGRLKPGVTAAQATAEMESLIAQINRQHPVADGGNSARAVPLRDAVAGHYREALAALLAAVALLLLIACANVGNLLLAKASARRREMTVRTALGATRRRLVRQLVAESLILGTAGGAAGLALAYLSVPALLALIPVELPRWMDFSVDYRVVTFTLAISILTSLAFGTVPAFVVSRDVAPGLTEASRGRTASARQHFLRNGLVIGEVALSLVLLAGAGLMVRSFLALRTQPLGYQPENVVTMQISASATQYPPGLPSRELLRRLTTEVESLPGVVSTAFASGVPLAGVWGRGLTVEGHPVLALKDTPSIFYVVTTPGYFRTLGIPLRRGRDFTEQDYDSPRVTIVDESLARRYWPRESALGKRVRFGPPQDANPWHTIVGVAGDARHEAIKGGGRWAVYVPWQSRYSPDDLLVRGSTKPAPLAQVVKARITGVDRNIVVSRVLTLEQVVDRASWQDRFFAVLFAIFAALATVLAAAGLYAVLAYTVSLRTQEIGIRMALGASASQVRAMVMRHGLALAVAGLLLGVLAASAVTRLLKSQLYRTSPLDPGTYIAVVLLMLLVAGSATLLPSRRATRVDPMVALRQE